MVYNKKRKFLIFLIPVALVLIIAFSILWAVLEAKYKTANELLQNEKYEEAYAAFSSIEIYRKSDKKRNECVAAHFYDVVITDQNYTKAFEIISSNIYTKDSISFAIQTLPNLHLQEEQYESYYAIISDIIALKPTFDDWRSFGHINNSHLMHYMLSNLPMQYQDVSYLYMLFGDIKGYKTSKGDYLKTNFDLLSSLWKYSFVKDYALSDTNIQKFLVGTWSTSQSSILQMLSPYLLEFKESNSRISFSYRGLKVPDVAHRYYDIVDHVLVYKNDDITVCNVFKFEFDETDPDKMIVYSYEEDTTYQFYRTKNRF